MDAVASPTSGESEVTPRVPDAVERKTGLVHSQDITVQKHRSDNEPAALSKPPLLKHVYVDARTSSKPRALTREVFSSSPAYSSPLRHHQRNPSTPHRVKESLDARSEYVTSEDDGVAEHRINQYTIKQEIGRGSFGAVHLALDQYDKEYVHTHRAHLKIPGLTMCRLSKNSPRLVCGSGLSLISSDNRWLNEDEVLCKASIHHFIEWVSIQRTMSSNLIVLSI